MCETIEHRGPDSRGIHIDGRVGLGIQRLRVIDVETGDQPIYNEERDVVVVLNGEIYNFPELRSRLIASGHEFRTRSDTEVIVHLYEEHGVDCVRSLHGMFAFALWDSRRQRLLLARDRVGKKPLFFARKADGLTFGSELPSVMADTDIPRTLSPRALQAFLAFGYVPAPLSVFDAVEKLPPATILLYEDGKITTERYWRLDYSRKRAVTDPAELHEEIRTTLRHAVRRRMISDVPLGAFLSGGIDSSAVVAAMSEAASEPVKTFAIGFDDERMNELPHAREVAELFGCEHHEFIVHPDAVSLAPSLIRAYGEPFADPSAIPSMYLAEVTRRHVTVALNGDGGDESFAGYSRYAANALAQRLSIVPQGARRAVAAVAARVPPAERMDSNRERARRLARLVALPPAARYARYMAYVRADQRAELYTPEFLSLVDQRELDAFISTPWAGASGSSPIDVMLEVDVESYLPGDLLVKMDIASMAYSLEARSPFLDTEVMELAASIPASYKVRGTEKKVVLRDALRGLVPDAVLDRPKHGFGVPLSTWFRGPLREWKREILLDPATVARGYFDRAAVARLLDRHDAGTEDAVLPIWAMIVFELWHREFVDR